MVRRARGGDLTGSPESLGRTLSLHSSAAMRTFLKRVGAVLLGLVALLVLAEASVRIWSFFYFPKMIRFDERLGWRRRPDTRKEFVNAWGERSLVVANRYGNRGVAYPPERIPGTYRVLVLGDSFAEGAQVNEEDLFTAQVERSESGCEIVNAAVVGYGTVQEYLYLRDEGIAFHPDLVLVFVFGNDLSDNVLPYSMRMGPRPYAVLEPGGVRIVEETDWAPFTPFRYPFPCSAFLYRHSYLYYALTDRIYVQAHRAELTRLDDQNMNRMPWADRKRVLFDVLLRMKEFTATHRIDIAVFLIPKKEEVGAGVSADQDEIAGWCDGHAIGCIRGLEPMRRAMAAGLRPYFEADIHWTRAGHDVAAAETTKFLREKMRRTGVPRGG
jgi:hypothetical protein